MRSSGLRRLGCTTRFNEVILFLVFVPCSVGCNSTEVERFQQSGPLYPIALLGAMISDVGTGVEFVASPGKWGDTSSRAPALKPERLEELSRNRVYVPRPYIDLPAMRNTSYVYIDEVLVSIGHTERVCGSQYQWFVDHTMSQAADSLASGVIAVNPSVLLALPPPARVVRLVNEASHHQLGHLHPEAVRDESPWAAGETIDADKKSVDLLVRAGWPPFVVERDLMLIALQEQDTSAASVSDRSAAIRSRINSR